jgi:hypothetical protein
MINYFPYCRHNPTCFVRSNIPLVYNFMMEYHNVGVGMYPTFIKTSNLPPPISYIEIKVLYPIYPMVT